jgi:hypothetical protein
MCENLLASLVFLKQKTFWTGVVGNTRLLGGRGQLTCACERVFHATAVDSLHELHFVRETLCGGRLLSV